MFLRLILAVTLVSCASLHHPNWYTNPPQNDGQFLYGVGMDIDPELARKASLENAANRISSTVSSKFENISKSDNAGALSTNSSVLSIKTDDIKFSNPIFLVEQKGSSYYAMVKVDKQKFIEEYTAKINQDVKELEVMLENVSTKLAQKIALRKINKKSPAILRDISILRSISDSTDLVVKIDKLNHYKNDEILISKELEFAINSNDDDLLKTFKNNALESGLVVIGNASDDKAVSINLTAKKVETNAFGMFMTKSFISVEVTDKTRKALSSKTIEISGSSSVSNDLAFASSLKQIDEQIKNDGFFKTVGLDD
jgi:hypothetical protein